MVEKLTYCKKDDIIASDLQLESILERISYEEIFYIVINIDVINRM